MAVSNAGGAGDTVIQYTSGSTWKDMGCWASEVTLDAWDRATGSVNVFCIDEAVIGFGKLGLTGMGINALYTDGDSPADLIDTLFTQHTAIGGGMFQIRVNPQGTGSGKTYIETHTDSKIDSLTPVDSTAAAQGEPLMLSFHVTTSRFNKATN
jgi:hypothetical protein